MTGSRARSAGLGLGGEGWLALGKTQQVCSVLFVGDVVAFSDSVRRVWVCWYSTEDSQKQVLNPASESVNAIAH